MRAAAYARFSSSNQREESITAQMEAINKYAESNGITIVKSYADEGISGTSDARPAFLSMMDDVKAGKYDLVIVHKLDRFSRNKYDHAIYKRLLRDHGTRLVSVLENLDESPESLILESVLEGMSEYYSQNLSREVKKGQRVNAEGCRFNGGTLPFGYGTDADQRYVINEHEAVAVRHVFDAVVSGQPYGDIVTWLNDHGYKTHFGRQFTRTSINGILHNEKYKGVYAYGTRRRVRQDGAWRDIPGDAPIVTEGGVPAIVSAEVWDQANQILKARQHVLGGRNKAKEIYLLSGLVYCGCCGGIMSGDRSKGGHAKCHRITYRCNNRQRKVNDCKQKPILRDLVEEVVITELERFFSEANVDNILELLEEEIAKQSNDLPDEINACKSRITGLDTAISNCVDLVCSGVKSPALVSKLEGLEREKEMEELKLREFERQAAMIRIPDREAIRAILCKDMDVRHISKDRQKRVIETYIKKVIVKEDNISVVLHVDTGNVPEAYAFVSTYRIEASTQYRHVLRYLDTHLVSDLIAA